MKRIIFLLLGMVMFSCSSVSNKDHFGENFFETLSSRQNPEKMLSFYSNSFEYRDMIFHSETNDPEYLIKTIYGWDNPGFQYEGGKMFSIEEIVSNEFTVVAKGKTMPYVYNGNRVEGVEFVIWLDLDEDSRIKGQTDWYNYSTADILEAQQIRNSLEIK